MCSCIGTDLCGFHAEEKEAADRARTRTVLSELRDTDLAVLAEVVAEAEGRAQAKALESMRLACSNCRDTATEAHRTRVLALGRIRRALRS